MERAQTHFQKILTIEKLNDATSRLLLALLVIAKFTYFEVGWLLVWG